MKEIYEANTGLSSLGLIEKPFLKPQIDPITPCGENKPQVQVVQLIVKIGKFAISVVVYAFVSCTFSFIYIFYLVPLCGQSTTSSQPAFMTVSMTLTNKSSFLSARAANPFSSPSQSPSAVHSSIKSVSQFTPNPEGRMIWTKKPKDLKEEVRWKELRPSHPLCLPVLPSRCIDKKGTIRSSTRENFEKRDLCGGNTSDQNMLKYHAQVVVTSMKYAFYYQCGMECSRHVPHIVLALPKLILLIRENAIEGFQTLPLELQEKVAKAVPQVVPHLSNFESGLKIVEKFTNKKEETKMNLTEQFKQRQSVRLNDIKNDPILKDEIQTAQGTDFENFVSGREGTRSRFKTLKDIFRKDNIDHCERCYRKGNLNPIRNLTLAVGCLSDWDPNYPLSTGSDRFIQKVLSTTSSVTKQNTRDLQNRRSLENSSVQQEPDFVVCRLVGQGMSCLDTLFKNEKKGVPPNNIAFWKKKGKELIAESFAEASTILEKNGIPSDKLNNSLNKVLPEYLRLEEED
nr:hypothetical protein [Klebsormidium nitens]